jgi:hypothetical protein
MIIVLQIYFGVGLVFCEAFSCGPAVSFAIRLDTPNFSVVTASWRSGYAEDCKSLHPSSILGEASKV